jgi:hypothetical protein
LKTPPGAAGAGVVSAEFLEQFLVAVDDPDAALDVRLGWVALAAFAAHFKSRNPRGGSSWCPPGLLAGSEAGSHGGAGVTSERGGEVVPSAPIVSGPMRASARVTRTHQGGGAGRRQASRPEVSVPAG